MLLISASRRHYGCPGISTTSCPKAGRLSAQNTTVMRLRSESF